MKVNLPDSISSSMDLADLILEIRDYARWYSHEAIKKSVNVQHPSELPNLSPASKELLRDWEPNKSVSQEGLDELIGVLEDCRDIAPSISFTLAAPANGEVRKTLVVWCRKNINPNMLVDFKFNATLAGGMVVRYGSRIFDWSFRRQILDAREHFPEVLRRV